jgi:predicted NBD/HSP70 family sugar kinase
MVNILNSPLKEANDHTEKRQQKQFKNIVRCLSKSDSALSIPDIAEYVKISVPTCTKLVRTLVEKSYLIEEGKKETENGRRPEFYALNKQRFYAIGVEILLKFIHVSIVRIDSKLLYETSNNQFVLENTPEGLQYVVTFIKDAITENQLKNDQIIGLGVGLAGTVNVHTGETKYFNFMGVSFKKYLENTFKIPVIIDTDTRAIGIAEQVMGKAQGIENVLIVKVSRSIGLSVILNGKMIVGGTGQAGEFGHLQLGKLGRLCVCGKKGCLETEVSGVALQIDLKEALIEGEISNYLQVENVDSYQYHDVLKAVLNGDALALKLILNQADKLGQALGNIVNLLNPDLIVISGEIVMIQDFYIDALKMGLKKTSLIDSLANCRVEVSNLGRYFSSKAAAAIVFKNYDLTKY